MRASRAIASAALGACAACVALVVRAQPAGDDAARVGLTWRAPAGCPDEASVRADVARLLSGSSAPLHASAEVEHSGASWRVVVSMNGGVRRLEASSCRALAEATELIVAMAVDPARVAANRASLAPPAAASLDAGAFAIEDAAPPRASDSLDAATAIPIASSLDAATADAQPSVVVVAPVPAPVASAQPIEDAGAPAEATPPPPPAPRVSPSKTGTTFAIQATGALDRGTLPALAAGASIALAWTPSSFRFEIAGAYFLPDSTSPAPISGAVERFTLITGAARACYLARPKSFDVGPCFEAEVASVRGDGVDIAHPSHGSSALFAPGAGLFGAWRFTPSWAAVGRLDALIPLIRPDFQVDTTTLHRPAFVTGRLSLGAELRF